MRKKGYGTYCPVSLATEVLGERWTIPLVLALLQGTTRFNDLKRALPRIPPSTLSQRLTSLEQAGLLERNRGRRGEACDYRLTEAGRELEPIILELGAWGQRWARDMVPDDLDIHSLAWSVHNRLNTHLMPKGRTVLEFELSGEAAHFGRFWIVHEDGEVDVCVKHPGHEVDVRVVSDIRRFVEAWRGFRSLEAEVAAGRIRLEGPRELRRAFPHWLLLSSLAHVERRRPGRERAMRERRVRGREGAGPARGRARATRRHERAKG